MTVNKDQLPYRPCVGIMLINRDGQIFVAKRHDTAEQAWQMPQGGIDPGEAPATAAVRELHEETAVENAEMMAESDDWRNYDLPDHLIGKVWGGRYRGQTQKWFAFRFLGRDDEIDLDGHDHSEFSAWKWASIDDLSGLIVPFKRQLYMDVVAEFRHLAVAL